MPRNTLEKAKAFQKEALRFRTAKRIEELRAEQGKLERLEVLNLCALLWLCMIVAFYARLYLGPYKRV
jgi:hypothetical protein